MAQDGQTEPRKPARIPLASVGCSTHDFGWKRVPHRSGAGQGAGGGTGAHRPATVGRIADRLGTSSRTLQRHLADQGVSLRAIVEESRLEIARVLLCKTDLDVQEIAAWAGYSTPSGLARAFARWTGCSPRTYRKAGRRLVRT